MKRLAAYFFCILGLSVMFSICYYWSYQNALKKFNKQSVERNTEFLKNLEEYQKQEQLLAIEREQAEETETGEGTESGDTISVGTSSQDLVLPSTKYYLLSFELTTDELFTEQLAAPSELIGLNRAQVIELLSDYMKEVPLEDYEKGLYAYELLSFSEKEVIVRKSYNRDLVPDKYYMVVENGKVVVYYSDLKTVYEYTNIEALYLPEETRNELMKGIYIKDKDELFTLLESFTS